MWIPSKIQIKKVIGVFLIGHVLISCTKKPEYTYITDDDFKENIQLHRKGNIDVFGHIDEFCVVDSLIAVELSQDTAVFGIYNLNTSSFVRSWGNKGRAENEYLIPRVIKYNDSCFIIWDKTYAKMEFYDLNNLDHFNKKETKEINDMPLSICYTGDEIFVYDRKYSNEISLFRWHLGDTPVLIATLDEYADRYENSKAYSGFLEANLKGDRVIYAFQYMDGFDLFDMNGNKIKQIRRKDSENPPYEISHRDAVTYCFGIRKGEYGFFLYRVGFTGEELLKERDRVTYIEEYDWDGNPIRRYELPMFVSNFDRIPDGRFVIQDDTSEDAALQIFAE